MDIGPTLMTKIIKENGWVFHRCMYQALTQEKWKQEECKAKHSSFMASLHLKLGPLTELRDLVDVVVEDTLQYDPYEEGSHNAEMFLMFDEEPEVAPEWGNKYKMARG